MTRTERLNEILVHDLTRAFRRRPLPSQPTITVHDFPNDEMYVAVVDGVPYVCIAGSDDDNFCFRSNTGDKIEFDFSDEWLKIACSDAE